MNEDEIDFLHKIAKFKFSNDYFSKLNNVAEARLNEYDRQLKYAKKYAREKPYNYRDDVELGKTIKERKETYIQEILDESLDEISKKEQIYDIPLDYPNIEGFISDKQETSRARDQLAVYILFKIPLFIVSVALVLGLVDYLFDLF